MSVRIYVGNLPKEAIDRDKLHEMFVEFSDQISTKVIKDRKSGKCRGFAFVTVSTDEIAQAFIEKFNGQSFMESKLTIEKAQPRSKGKSGDESNSGSNSPKPAGGKRNQGKKGSNNSSGNNNSGSIQPDPRWADQLAQLKEMLAAQASNS